MRLPCCDVLCKPHSTTISNGLGLVILQRRTVFGSSEHTAASLRFFTEATMTVFELADSPPVLDIRWLRPAGRPRLAGLVAQLIRLQL